jgi:hypothetical protein
MPPGTLVSFTLDYNFSHFGGHYLSGGEMYLPVVNYILAGLFAITLGIWLLFCCRRRVHVQKIHYLMTVCLVVKLCSLIAEAIMYKQIDLTGLTTGWSTVSHILVLIRSVLLLVVLALIAAGWSVLKPYLSCGRRKSFSSVAYYRYVCMTCLHYARPQLCVCMMLVVCSWWTQYAC